MRGALARPEACSRITYRNDEGSEVVANEGRHVLAAAVMRVVATTAVAGAGSTTDAAGTPGKTVTPAVAGRVSLARARRALSPCDG